MSPTAKAVGLIFRRSHCLVHCRADCRQQRAAHVAPLEMKRFSASSLAPMIEETSSRGDLRYCPSTA
jgi:hypothetical protein